MVLRNMYKILRPCLFCIAATAALSHSGCSGEQDEKDSERADTDGKDDNNPDDDNEDTSQGNDASDGKDPDKQNTSGGDNSNDDSGATSQEAALMKYSAGSRLKPQVIEASDGAKQFYGWYDKELEVRCSFAMLSHATPAPKDGAKMRCLPPMLRLELDKYYDTNGCNKDPIGIGRPVGCDDPSTFKYGKVLPSQICGGEPKLKKLKSVKPLKSDDWIWYKDSKGYCKMVDTDISPYVYVEVGDDASMDDFVGGTTEDS